MVQVYGWVHVQLFLEFPVILVIVMHNLLAQTSLSNSMISFRRLLASMVLVGVMPSLRSAFTFCMEYFPLHFPLYAFSPCMILVDV